jgi:hypothetical protein
LSPHFPKSAKQTGWNYKCRRLRHRTSISGHANNYHFFLHPQNALPKLVLIDRDLGERQARDMLLIWIISNLNFGILRGKCAQIDFAFGINRPKSENKLSLRLIVLNP